MTGTGFVSSKFPRFRMALSSTDDEFESMLRDEEKPECLFPSQRNMGILSLDSLRKYFFWLAQLIEVAIIVLTLIYIFNYRNGFGGRDYPKLEFSWHILFMTLGITYFLVNSLLTFRLMPLMSKPKLKLIHLGFNACAIICVALGLFFVIDERETQGKAHFQSLHSWIGIASIALMVFQFVSGAVVYLSSKVSQSIKEYLMPWHIQIGVAIFLLGIGALITGMKKGKSAPENLLLNCTGGLVVILCFLVLHIISERNYKFSFRIK